MCIRDSLQCEVALRLEEGEIKITDNGNYIADAITGPTISDPVNTESDILNIAGVVQVGLFNNMCDAVILAGYNGIETLINPNGNLV